jgi:hypothetical protein
MPEDRYRDRFGKVNVLRMRKMMDKIQEIKIYFNTPF